MRGVISVMIVAFFMIAYMFAAPAAVEGVGEEIRDRDVLDDSDRAIIDAMYDSLFKWIPLVVLFGMCAWAVAWYVREQIIIGRI